ncbi:MAG: hypothetical protein WC955_02935 [Elusimicrobiota bacterium]
MNYFTYRYLLFKLNKQKDKLNRSFNELSNKNPNNDTNEYQNKLADLGYEDNCLQEDIALLKTRYLRDLASKLSLPIPDWKENEMWEQDGQQGRYYLTNKGITYLRDSIRKEQKESKEIIFQWVAFIVGTIIGLLGAITGLVAVYKK